MKTIIHKIDNNTRRISLVHRPKTNLLAIAGSHFTTNEKAAAKIKYEASYRNRHRNSFHDERAELISALVGVTETPRMNLLVNLNGI